MSTLAVVQQACDEIAQACDKIEKAFLGTGYVFPRSGIDCIINEARQQALGLDHEPPLPSPTESPALPSRAVSLRRGLGNRD